MREREIVIVEIDDEEVIVRRSERVDIRLARLVVLGVEQNEEVFHLTQLRDVVRVLVHRATVGDHIEEAVTPVGDIALCCAPLLHMADLLALHIVEDKDLFACHERLAQHGGKELIRLRIVALRFLPVLLVAVIEAGFHKESIQSTDEARDVLLRVILRHFEESRRSVADKQKARLLSACIVTQLHCEIDHRRLGYDARLSGSIIDVAPAGLRQLIQPEQSCCTK